MAIKEPMSVNGSTTNRMATMRYMRMLPRGNQWGFRGLSSASKKVPMDGNPGSVSGLALTQSP